MLLHSDVMAKLQGELGLSFRVPLKVLDEVGILPAELHLARGIGRYQPVNEEVEISTDRAVRTKPRQHPAAALDGGGRIIKSLLAGAADERQQQGIDDRVKQQRLGQHLVAERPLRFPIKQLLRAAVEDPSLTHSAQ